MYQGQRLARFDAPRYDWPRGYGYQRYAIGARLPSVFLTRTYYLDDYARYDLAPPPAGSTWIRFGPDLLLISLTDGVIAETVYGAFEEPPVVAGASDDRDQN